MFLRRRSSERGHVNHGWLDTFHTFSFANYYDPDWMGFGPLRVINEDTIAANRGFDEHHHSDMEILTYVIEGALQHRDSLGSGSIIRPNQIQYMSAGTGILHSEFNPEDKPVHLLQIWIEPNEYGAAPRYQEKNIQNANRGELQLLASPDGKNDSIAIRQNAEVYRGVFEAGNAADFAVRSGRKQWIQLIEGELVVNEETLFAGDGCGVENETRLKLSTKTKAHFLLFDLP